MEEIKLKTPLVAIHEFAKTLTAKVRELDELEREWKIGTGQSAEILEQMIESHLYAVFKTMLVSHRVTPEDKEAAYKAMMHLMDKGLLVPTAHTNQNTIKRKAQV